MAVQSNLPSEYSEQMCLEVSVREAIFVSDTNHVLLLSAKALVACSASVQTSCVARRVVFQCFTYFRCVVQFLLLSIVERCSG